MRILNQSVQSNVVPIIEVKRDFVRVPSNVEVTTRTFDDIEETIYEYDEEIVPINEYIHEIDNKNLDNAMNSLSLDFRVMEVEFTLEGMLPQTKSSKKTKNTNTKGMMDMTPYKMCKVVIIGGAYTRADMDYKISIYVKRGRMTQAEADELTDLMNARELVYGEK